MKSAIFAMGRLVPIALLSSLGIARGQDFDREIRPIFAAHCFRCHGKDKPKGGIDLTRYTREPDVVADLKTWRGIGEAVSEAVMPPAGEPELGEDDRERVARWLGAAVMHAEEATPSDPGPGIPRRVTRREYRNMVRDLFGVSVDVESYLPDARSAAGYDNEAAQLSVPPDLLEKYLLLAERVVDAAFPNIYNSRRQEPIKGWFAAWEGEPLVEGGKKGVTARVAAELDLRRLARLAYRRPAEEGEVAILLKLFDGAYADKKSFHEGLRFAVKGLLLAPQFLYRTEVPPGDETPILAEDFELASRLSFFLWSSLPDAELLRLAEAGELRRPGVLRAQARRMMKDPKARALATDFPPQWLFGRLARHTLDRVLFPDYTPALAKSAEDELATFFQTLVKDGRSVIELLDADYTFANEELAGVYGLKGVAGKELRRVPIDDRRRGGLLGMAVVLQKTSMPNRTSPTIRGKWVLDSILGTPPPPPPSTVNTAVDAAGLAEDGRVLSFREKLALHAKQGSACGECHRKIDPLGFALEDFSPLGQLRVTEDGKPVDNTGRLAGGPELKGAASVKAVLLDRKDRFLRNLVVQLLTYALGRELGPYDLPTVRRVADAVKAGQYRADLLIEEVAVSYPCLHKRAPREAEAPQPTEGKE